MSYSISNLNADLGAMLHGTDLNQVQNLFGMYNRAGRQLLLDIDPQEMKRITPFTTPIYNQVFDYALPVDLKGNKVIDIAPQVNRTSNDVYLQDYNQAFDVTKIWTGQDQFTILFNTGIKTIRIAAPNLNAPVQINQAANPTSNGTWTTGGGATNLQTNNLNYVVGGGSLQLDLAAGQFSGFVENSTMNSLNLSSYLNQATNFLYTYLPTASSVSAVEIRLGTNSANYYVLNTNITQSNTAFQNGWNLLQYVWKNMTVVGAPNAANIQYVRVTWTYDGTLQTAVFLNDIFTVLGSILNLEYYSKYLFRDAITGGWQETVTDNSNLINLDTESYQLYTNLVAYLAAQQVQGLSAAFFDSNYFLQAYGEGLKRYKSMYKSEVQIPQSTYYIQPNPSQGQWSGRARWGF